MLTRIFPEKHLDAIINTMNGYEAVIDAIKKGKHIDTDYMTLNASPKSPLSILAVQQIFN